MPVSANFNSNIKQKYVPPSLRNKNTSLCNPNHNHTSSASSTKKNEPKKEFSLADAFPTLGETMKQQNNSTINSDDSLKNKNPISFSSAASKKTPEKIEDTTDTETILLPGWVYISKSNNNSGTIKYKYKFVETKITQNELELAYKENKRLGEILFKYRIAREQYERDMDVERLGDLSEFYGEPTLIEMYENDSNLHFNEEDLNLSDNDF